MFLFCFPIINLNFHNGIFFLKYTNLLSYLSFQLSKYILSVYFYILYILYVRLKNNIINSISCHVYLLDHNHWNQHNWKPRELEHEVILLDSVFHNLQSYNSDLF